MRSAEEVRAAAGAGADAVGLNFWPRSKRYLALDAARACAAAAPAGLLRVGVFVDATPEEIARLAVEVPLDAAQLHGEEPPLVVDRLRHRLIVIKAIRLRGAWDLGRAVGFGQADAILADAYEPGRPGGTGLRAPWEALREARFPAPWILAGGLGPDTVADALAAVRPSLPSGVDACSAREGPDGRKPPERIVAFVSAARATAAWWSGGGGAGR